MTERIPGPTGLPFVGVLFRMVNQKTPFDSIEQFSSQYGEIYTIEIMGVKLIWATSYAMLHELCDETRFDKAVHNHLNELRNIVHDGLFTAATIEKNWGIAHRTLVPALGPLNVASMFEPMRDISTQLVLKWLRHGPEHEIKVTEDFTRLTLDTIALCAMGYRFNSFYTEKMHPFVGSMGRALEYTDVRGFLPRWVKSTAMRSREALNAKDIAYMREVAGKLIQQRKENPRDSKDLLNAMLVGKDPKTGAGLDAESIIDNLITFLIAGHETTSGMLSFTMFYLCRNKEAYQRVQKEVDEVVGQESVALHHLKRLPYINAVLRESSRLNPTAPVIGFTPKSPQGEVVGGKYRIAKGDSVLAYLNACHRDPAVWGDDADEFKPERMLDENFGRLPPNAMKTFGNGKRACIGQTFANQEMLLVLVMLFQKFDFKLANPDYVLEIDFMLTIKPLDLFIKAKPRNDTPVEFVSESRPSGSETTTPRDGLPMTIFFGSNSGTCETLAQRLANDAAEHGFRATVDRLDTATRNLPESEPVVIITASYEGQPTDDATKFFEWIETGFNSKSKFAIFGCGDADWKHTFHKVPKAIDQALGQYGVRICQVGLADARNGNVMNDFQEWEDNMLWPALDTQPRATYPKIDVQISTHRAPDVSVARVVAAGTLTTLGDPIKKHIQIELPTTYKAGDYCAILPFNPPLTVHRVMTRFGLSFDTVLTIKSRDLPKHPISALDLFGSHLELSQPATRRDITMLINASGDESLKSLYKDFDTAISQKYTTLLDLLEQNPNIDLPISAFIASLMPMRVRVYSIASSPLAHSNEVVLIYDVFHPSNSQHFGVASNYLAGLVPGDVIHATVRTSKFRLPEPDIPMIMIAAGSGIAPFRGFVQERAALIATGRTLAPAYLFFGCRGAKRDDLYRKDFDAWEKLGAITVYRAYSQDDGKHVDQKLLGEKELLATLWAQGAKVYVCGSRRMGDAVKQAFFEIARDLVEKKGEDDVEEGMQRWFEDIVNQRYLTDVFD